MISHTFACIHCTKVSDLVESTTSSTGENTTEANDDGVKGEKDDADNEEEKEEEENISPAFGETYHLTRCCC